MALWTESTKVDDFFGDEDETDADGAHEQGDGTRRRHRCLDGHDWTNGLAAKEAAAVEEKYRTLGYHETYETSQEATLQEGFVAGYSDTFDVAVSIGTLLGRAAASRLQLREQSRQSNSRITLEEKEDTQNGAAYRIAAARIREVLTSTAPDLAEPLPPTVEEADAEKEGRDAITHAAKRDLQALKELQLEIEHLLPGDDGSSERD